MDDETEKGIRESKSRIGYSDYSLKEMIFFLVGRIALFIILLPFVILPLLFLYKIGMPLIIIEIILLLEFLLIGYLAVFINED